MKEEKEVLQERKPKKLRLKMAIAILITAALFVVELYVMINYAQNYLLLGILGLAILCFVYLITDLTFLLQDEKDISRKEEFESVYKAEKVAYVTMKKGFVEISRSLDRIRELSEVPTEELIQAQKAVGRVTIQRNKENAIAVIDSNEKLDDILQAAKNPELLDSQQTILSRIESLESSESELKAELLKLSRSLAKQMNLSLENVDDIELADGFSEENDVDEAEILETDDILEETNDVEMSDLIDDITDSITSESDDTETSDLTDDIADSLSSESDDIETSDLTDDTSIQASADTVEETIVPDIPAAPDTTEVLEVSNDAEEAVPASNEEPPELKRTMTPEEIAALLESQAEPEPEPEKTAAPDLSDPGHVMTPEEIAALLSNM